MNEDDFFHQLKILYGRVTALHKNTRGAPWQKEAWLPFALEELNTAFEELQVAEEELRAQNEELAVAQAAMEAERQRYQELFEFAPDGYLVTDAQGKIQEANLAAARLLNIEQRFLVGKPLLNFVAEPERRDFRTKLNQLCRTPQEERLAATPTPVVQEYEVRLYPRVPKGHDLKDSLPFDAALTVSTTRGCGSQASALRWLVRDVTARNRAQERLRLLESVAVNLNEAVVITKAEPLEEPGPRILYVNQAFTRMTGYSPQEVVAKSPRFMQGPQTDRAALDTVRTALERFEPVVVELLNYHKNGSTYWVEMSLVPVADETGCYTHWVAVERDITERKRSEEAQAQLIREQAARTEAEAANRAKDEFLAVVSHELRTPLNAILGWAQLLSTKKLDDARTAKALETIVRNARSQAQLIEDLLDISRITAGTLRLHMRPSKLVPLTEAVIETLRPAIQAKALHFEAKLDPSVGLVSADPDRLRQVVWNLLSNAIKFTPPGGQVEVTLKQVEEHWVNGPMSRQGTADPSSHFYAQIEVSDTGIGITSDFLPYVFERFRQSDSRSTRSSSGLGLGLAIVRQLVELHGGTVHATSRGEGQGATFMVKLPLVDTYDLDRSPGVSVAAEKENPDGVASAQTGVLSGQGANAPAPEYPPPVAHPIGGGAVPDNFPVLAGLRVLVVEDEAEAREYITVVLEQCRGEVIVVTSVDEALEVLPRLKPDVLISDVGMPEKDGYALIRQVRTLKPEQGGQIPAAALTAYAREEDRVHALAAGFQMHVPKPVEPAELIEAVARLARLA